MGQNSTAGKEVVELLQVMAEGDVLSGGSEPEGVAAMAAGGGPRGSLQWRLGSRSAGGRLVLLWSIISSEVVRGRRAMLMGAMTLAEEDDWSEGGSRGFVGDQREVTGVNKVGRKRINVEKKIECGEGEGKGEGLKEMMKRSENGLIRLSG